MIQATGIQPKKEESPLELVPFDRLVDRVNTMMEQIARRAFEIFEGKGRMFGNELADWFQAESERLHPVLVDFKETEQAFSLKAEVPGFAPEELEISAEPRRVIIVGKKHTKEEKKKGKTLFTEINDEMCRVVGLPAEVDTAKISATLKDGVLEMTLPKATVARKVAIEPKKA